MEKEIGERVETSLLTGDFEIPPSPEYFESNIELRNVPAVFRGVVKNWNAISKWNPCNGGLDYLEESVGSTTIVEAMMSNHAHIFYGDLRSHERVPVLFSAFISSCKSYLENSSNSGVEEKMKESVDSEGICLTSLDSPDHFYLAQVPIFCTEKKERCSLDILREDIEMPAFLGNKTVSSINFWMNRARSRSSTHYDPHHNILCVISGHKEVTLWPPSASPFLYPMPIYGEASNHSAVSISNPDFSIHARAKHMKEYSQKVVLKSGDALFIPEGWFHQVDSSDLTIAINFWWVSNIISNMEEHMDSYYLRRLLNRLVGKEMARNSTMKSFLISKFKSSLINSKSCVFALSLSLSKDCLLSIYEIGQDKMLDKSSSRTPVNGENFQYFNEAPKVISDPKSEGNGDKGSILDQLDPHAMKSLSELVSLVHDTISTPSPSKSGSDLSVPQISERDELIANIFLCLDPLMLHKVLISMVYCFPRTLEALVLHVIGPISAEILTRKFDQIDEQITKEQREDFFKLFYSVFDDPSAAMDALLNRKETFSFLALRNVLDQYLGVQVVRPS